LNPLKERTHHPISAGLAAVSQEEVQSQAITGEKIPFGNIVSDIPAV
jgi:hypothetical protein